MSSASQLSNNLSHISNRRPIVRTREGCLTCRKRKVKCDLEKPECARCLKYPIKCVYPGRKERIPPRVIRPTPSTSTALQPTPKRRQSTLAQSSSATTLPLPPSIDDLPDIPIAEDISQSTGLQTQPFPSATPDAPHISPRYATQMGWQTTLEALGPVDRLLAVCRNTRMSSFFVQPTAPPDFLKGFFPTSDDLQCFHHCVTYTLSIIVVSEDHNPWMNYVAPLFMAGQGEESSGHALRLSMLYLGAVHLSYLQGRDGNASTSTRTRSLALRYRTECITLIRRLCGIGPFLCDSAFLSACALTLTGDLLAANTRWRQLMRMVKYAVEIAGGMQAILFSSELVDPAMKCAVESLVSLSFLSTFSSGEDYTLLPKNTLFTEQQPNWWKMLEEAEKRQINLRRFEESCGICRSLFTLASALFPYLIKGNSLEMVSTNLIEGWYDWTGSEKLQIQNERIKTGSLVVWQAGKILILRKIEKATRSDERVQEAAKSILDICASVGDKVEYMNWPLIVACSTLIDPVSRDIARSHLKSFIPQCCYEIEVIQMLCEEMWARIDQGEDDEACGWVEVLLESGCSVLLG